MIRFIINFIVFGLIFYAIWYFFPDAFLKMVNGAGAVFSYLKDLIESLIQKLNEHRPHPKSPRQPNGCWAFLSNKVLF